MTMTIDPNQQRFAPLNIDHMSSYSNHPQFTNPWASSSQAGAPPQNGGQGLYVASHNTNPPPPAGLPHLNLNGLAKHPHHPSRAASNASLAPYGSMPVTTAPAGSPHMADIYGQHNLPSMNQDPSSMNRLQQHPTSSAAYGDPSYTTAASPVNAPYAASPTPYDHLGYAPAPIRGAFALAPDPEQTRRYSQQSVLLCHCAAQIHCRD